MQMAEIIQFKKKLENTSSKLEKIFVDPDIEMVTDAVLSASLDSLIRLGYNLEDNFDTILPSIILLKETITSLQMKLKGTDHFLQEFAENTFVITDD
jgi:hypothetical protein